MIRQRLDDVRAAIGWAHSRADVALASRLLESIGFFAISDEMTDVGDLALTTLALGLDEGTPGASMVLALASYTHIAAGDREEAAALARRGLAAGGPDARFGRVWCYASLIGWVLRTEGLPAARELGDEWVDYSRHHGLPLTLPYGTLAMMHGYAGDLDAAEALVEQAFAAAEGESNRAYAYLARGEARSTTDPDAALRDYREAARLAAPAGIVTHQMALTGEAALLARSGDAAEALAGFQRLLTQFRERTHFSARIALVNLVDLLARLGEDDAAARLCGQLEIEPELDLTPVQQEDLDDLADRLGPEGFAQALQRGGELSRTAALDLALDTIARLRA